MKKTYIIPTIEVSNLRVSEILAGSVGVGDGDVLGDKVGSTPDSGYEGGYTKLDIWDDGTAE